MGMGVTRVSVGVQVRADGAAPVALCVRVCMCGRAWGDLLWCGVQRCHATVAVPPLPCPFVPVRAATAVSGSSGCGELHTGNTPLAALLWAPVHASDRCA